MFKEKGVAVCVGKILLCVETKRLVVRVVLDSFLMYKDSVLMYSNINCTFEVILTVHRR
jgi:hypothetical protein